MMMMMIMMMMMMMMIILIIRIIANIIKYKISLYWKSLYAGCSYF